MYRNNSRCKICSEKLNIQVNIDIIETCDGLDGRPGF
jgi:hypothetical protein